MIKREDRNWPELIAERTQRGLTVSQFCKEKGIPPSMFYAKSKDQTGVEQTRTPTKTDPSTSSIPAPPAFIEVEPMHPKMATTEIALARVLVITTSWGKIEVPL